MKDVIILPTYNERDNIVPLVSEIFATLPEVHIFVVDDNSPDGTADVVRSLMSRFKNLHLLSRKNKNGLGEAYKFAITEILKDKQVGSIITMDADGSHHPEYLPHLLGKLSTFDVVIGSRYVKGGGIENWEKWRKFLSGYGNLYSRILTGLGIRDMTAGFIATRRTVFDKIDFSKMAASGYAFLMEFKFHAVLGGARVNEHPIIFRERREGESKISSHIIREGLLTPLRLFWKRLWRR